MTKQSRAQEDQEAIAARLESAVQVALARVQSEAGFPGGWTGESQAIRSAAETAERRILRESGWAVEERGTGQPPRRMAQLGAAEVDRRRVILYDPFLRWIASRIGQDPEEGWLPAAIADRIQPLPLAEREAWIRLAVLSHELFHVMIRRGEGEGGTSGQELPEAAVEQSAEEFTNRLMVEIVSKRRQIEE